MTRYASARGRSAGGWGDPRARLLGELAIRAGQPAVEFSTLLMDPIFWGWGVPRGDGRAVLVLPGWFAGDGYLRPLRGWLRRIGYTPVPSGLDRNPGWSEELVAELGDYTEAAYRRDGRRVTIIGHSMGGLIARSIGARRPHAVAHVIALGAPLALARERFPSSVRLTAIWSRDDRIVRYPNACATEPSAVNLEVRGSHTGMTGNPEVYRHLARLLPEAPAAIL